MSCIKGNQIYIHMYHKPHYFLFITIIKYNTVIYKNNVIIIINEKQTNLIN